MSTSKWDARFLALAGHVAGWSKDPSTKVGAVIVDRQRRVVSMGFNGFPQGVEDRLDVSRETKLARTIHAEANALLFAQRNLAGCAIYVTRPPCSNCGALIIQSGIARVVYAAPDAAFMARWGDSIRESEMMFRLAGVDVVPLEMPA